MTRTPIGAADAGTILEFARTAPTHPAQLAAQVRARFGCSLWTYYQRLHRVAASSDGLHADPLAAFAVLRARDERRARFRSGHAAHLRSV